MNADRSSVHPFLLAGLLSSALSLLAGVSAPLAATPETKPSLTVEAILVTPAAPGADTLCKLRVVLKNHGTEPASAFGFQVKINGQALPVYEKQRYLDPIDPGGSKEIALFNFWSSETDRPFPKDGALAVEVALTEARWVAKRMEGDVPVWTMKELVTGLPATLTVRKPFKATAK